VLALASSSVLAPPDDRSGLVPLARAHDWASTPLGPVEQWPPVLRFAAQICVHSGLATAIYWGPQRIVVHNEAWQALIGGTPALGLPAAEALARLWPVKEAVVRQVEESGEGAFLREQRLRLLREGVEEEVFLNCSVLPLVGEDGRVAGILNQANDVTRAVHAERRISFQIDLADRLRRLNEPGEIKAAALELLGGYLGAARVGYAEVDREERTTTVRREWTRDPQVPSLAGQSASLRAFGPGAGEFLRTGEPIAIGDIEALAYLKPEQVQGWTDIGTRAMIVVPLVRDGAVKALLYVHEPRPRDWKRSEVAMARDVAERTWDALERATSAQQLRESEDHYRHAVELNPQVGWTALPDGQLNRVAPRWEEWTGSEGTGEGWANGLHPEDRQRTFDVWARCVATGEPYDIEHRVRRRDGSFRWARSRAFPRHGPDGAICLWYGTTEDIHQRKVAEERQQLLINELNHRVKNTLATVQAIGFQTLRGDLPLEEARGRFEARLLALSRAHNLLTDQNWEGAALDRVVRDSTAHLLPDRFDIEGEDVWLGPRAALALALALHELSTNAVKYGALSGDRGRVSIRWWLDEAMLRLEWKEAGGPPTVEPPSRGFGTRLIERGLAADLGGTARMYFEPDGLRCAIDASFEAIRARDEAFG
jgi:PAS domain S-box-containing protein